MFDRSTVALQSCGLVGGSVEQRNMIVGEDLRDLGAVSADPGIERVLPLPLAEAHAHRDLVVEPDLRIRLERQGDRKSTRLNSSHGYISYAVFCLKKKK